MFDAISRALFVLPVSWLFVSCLCRCLYRGEVQRLSPETPPSCCAEGCAGAASAKSASKSTGGRSTGTWQRRRRPPFLGVLSWHPPLGVPPLRLSLHSGDASQLRRVTTPPARQPDTAPAPHSPGPPAAEGQEQSPPSAPPAQRQGSAGAAPTQPQDAASTAGQPTAEAAPQSAAAPEPAPAPPGAQPPAPAAAGRHLTPLELAARDEGPAAPQSAKTASLTALAHGLDPAPAQWQHPSPHTGLDWSPARMRFTAAKQRQPGPDELGATGSAAERRAASSAAFPAQEVDVTPDLRAWDHHLLSKGLSSPPARWPITAVEQRQPGPDAQDAAGPAAGARHAARNAAFLASTAALRARAAPAGGAPGAGNAAGAAAAPPAHIGGASPLEDNAGMARAEEDSHSGLPLRAAAPAERSPTIATAFKGFPFVAKAHAARGQEGARGLMSSWLPRKSGGRAEDATGSAK